MLYYYYYYYILAVYKREAGTNPPLTRLLFLFFLSSFKYNIKDTFKIKLLLLLVAEEEILPKKG